MLRARPGCTPGARDRRDYPARTVASSSSSRTAGKAAPLPLNVTWCSSAAGDEVDLGAGDRQHASAAGDGDGHGEAGELLCRRSGGQPGEADDADGRGAPRLLLHALLQRGAGDAVHAPGRVAARHRRELGLGLGGRGVDRDAVLDGVDLVGAAEVGALDLRRRDLGDRRRDADARGQLRRPRRHPGGRGGRAARRPSRGQLRQLEECRRPVRRRLGVDRWRLGGGRGRRSGGRPRVRRPRRRRRRSRRAWLAPPPAAASAAPNAPLPAVMRPTSPPASAAAKIPTNVHLTARRQCSMPCWAMCAPSCSMSATAGRPQSGTAARCALPSGERGRGRNHTANSTSEPEFDQGERGPPATGPTGVARPTAVPDRALIGRNSTPPAKESGLRAEFSATPLPAPVNPATLALATREC